jgi:hypothetical protein
MFGLLAITVRENMRHGDSTSRGWLCFYLLIVAFGTGVSGSALEPAASILPAMAFTMALIPVLLPLVPRFHGTRLLRASAIVLATLAMPIGFARMSGLRAHSQDLLSCAETIQHAQGGERMDSVLVQRSGHFGFLYSGPVRRVSDNGITDPSITQAAVDQDAQWVLLPIEALNSSEASESPVLWRDESERTLWEATYAPFEVHGTWNIFRKR